MSIYISFDEIICNSIMLYLPPKEWRICKPFLISSKFSLVCSSEEFCKQFLVNLFKLSSEQVEQLEKACFMLSSSILVNTKPKKKKRKIHNDDDENSNLLMNRVAKSMREVLWIYLMMSSEYDAEAVKMDIIEHLQEFHKGVVNNVLEQAQEDLVNLQLESYLLKSFNYFTSEEPQRIMTRSKDFIISEKVLLKIFGNVKDLFLIGFEENGVSTEINLGLFTSFGYPLFFKSEYSSMSHGAIKEKLDVFEKHVFMHQLSHGDATDKFDKEMLALLQELLFPKNVDDVLVKEAKIPEQDLADTKLSLLYEFLQCCFGKNGTMFRRLSLGWIPFVGKVSRLMVREVGSTDFGSSSEEDSEEDEEYQQDENAESFSDDNEEELED